MKYTLNLEGTADKFTEHSETMAAKVVTWLEDIISESEDKDV